MTFFNPAFPRISGLKARWRDRRPLYQCRLNGGSNTESERQQAEHDSNETPSHCPPNHLGYWMRCNPHLAPALESSGIPLSLSLSLPPRLARSLCKCGISHWRSVLGYQIHTSGFCFCVVLLIKSYWGAGSDLLSGELIKCTMASYFWTTGCCIEPLINFLFRTTWLESHSRTGQDGEKRRVINSGLECRLGAIASGN